jgi:hypothetical protein
MAALDTFKNILMWRPKAGIVKSEYKFIARQRLGKHIPAAANMDATINFRCYAKKL